LVLFIVVIADARNHEPEKSKIFSVVNGHAIERPYLKSCHPVFHTSFCKAIILFCGNFISIVTVTDTLISTVFELIGFCS
jgi:hypothetical protein